MMLPPQLPRGRDGHRVSRTGMVPMAGARPGRGEHPGRSPGAGLWTSPLHSPVLSGSNTDAGLLLQCGALPEVSDAQSSLTGTRAPGPASDLETGY